jgi:acyl carrier protein
MSEDTVVDQLRVMFRQILGAGDDAAEPDFFELGGDSLAAVQLIGLIEDAFAVTPPVDAVFDAPTAPELAKVVEEMRGSAS